jgi:hypothetical protein
MQQSTGHSAADKVFTMTDQSSSAPADHDSAPDTGDATEAIVDSTHQTIVDALYVLTTTDASLSTARSTRSIE